MGAEEIPPVAYVQDKERNGRDSRQICQIDVAVWIRVSELVRCKGYSHSPVLYVTSEATVTRLPRAMRRRRELVNKTS